LNYAGIRLIGGIADANGDGDTDDAVYFIFCPDQIGGGGKYVYDSTTNFAKGYYWDPIPIAWMSISTPTKDLAIGSLVTIPITNFEVDLELDCNNDGQIDRSYCHSYFQYDIP
ncbi:MAG: hypothetical protein KAW09_08545, partial [Thermoplasmata archaeon]|nr:hypothetical protein [Thermoplasmata archaeon]